jgi:hypothetical protein
MKTLGPAELGMEFSWSRDERRFLHDTEHQTPKKSMKGLTCRMACLAGWKPDFRALYAKRQMPICAREGDEMV